MSTLREHIERVMRRPNPGIEPENYVPAPEPPEPVENAGIGRSRYLGQGEPFHGPLTSCRDCGVMVYDTPAHDRWHDGAVA